MNVADNKLDTSHLKPLLTPEEFRIEGLKGMIGRNSLYGMLQAGKIRHIKVGRKILIPRSEIEAFLEREAQGVQ